MKIQAQIEQKISSDFEPQFLEVLNESYMHNVPEGSESHFKVTLVSDKFEGKRSVARHQMVYKALGNLMDSFHALALHTYTPSEYQEVQSAPSSPQCMGGGK
ncbi:BolA family protein [Litoribacillus peritrichatus]|uniref:Transcriptional regulator BolA n=1 Tax=Litoribacillus peritrichatus TaxID=718191 RepID=A0ABP7M5F9_9GAMM